MATEESTHDAVVKALKKELENKHDFTDVKINTGTNKSHSYKGTYIDVIAKKPSDSDSFAFEVEDEISDTLDDSVKQWKDYNKKINDGWFLVVPNASKNKVKKIIEDEKINNCILRTWKKSGDNFNFPDLNNDIL